MRAAPGKRASGVEEILREWINVIKKLILLFMAKVRTKGKISINITTADNEKLNVHRGAVR